MLDNRSVAIAEIHDELLKFVFRMRMSSWPAEMRPELRRMLAEKRRRLMQA